MPRGRAALPHAITRGNGIIFSLSPHRLAWAREYRRRNGTLDLFSHAPIWHPHDTERDSGKNRNKSLAGAPEADVVVRAGRNIVQVECLHPIIAAIVPIAATDEPGTALWHLIPPAKRHDTVGLPHYGFRRQIEIS
jgi:hypothetical protein